MDLIGAGDNSVMVIHGGGVYGDKEETKKDGVNNIKCCLKKYRKRLVLENCEKCYSIKDCLKISDKVNIPVVFDTHHFECYKLLHPDEIFKHPSEYIEDILNTWKIKKIKPKFMHLASKGLKIGHHSDYIEIIPNIY